MPNYLVIANSGRAIAQGLKSLGHSVYVIDGYADCDTRAAANECKKVNRSQYGLDSHKVFQAVEVLRSKISFDGMFYDAVMESNPSILDEINVSPILGNSSHVLSACKNPEVFFSLLDQQSIPYPEISFQLEPTSTKKDQWLVKDAQACGGIGVSPVSYQVKCTKNIYLQQKIDGVSFSLTFLANGEEILNLGFNTLWSEEVSKKLPYVYAGAINSVKLDEKVKETALQYATIMAEKLKLVGLNSIDFIFDNQSIYVLEVNPRIPATYELYETKYGNLMQEHIDACIEHKLPEAKRPHLLRAHAVVYAPTDITIPADMSWPLYSADRPNADEFIGKHEPICSIYAGGKNSAQVNEMIKTRKQSILSKLAH